MKMFLAFILNLLLLVPICFSQQKASEQGAQSGSFIPSGVVMPYAGATAPSGWAFAYGQEVSQTSATYKNLYAAISTTYCTTEHGGTCTGGNFRLPDLRGRAIHGKDNMGGTAASRITSAATIDGTVLGKSGGAQTQASNVTVSVNGHTHSAGGLGAEMAVYGGMIRYNRIEPGVWNSTYKISGIPGELNSPESVNPGVMVSISGATGTSTATTTVGNNAVNNLAPTTIMNYIIKL